MREAIKNADMAWLLSGCAVIGILVTVSAPPVFFGALAGGIVVSTVLLSPAAGLSLLAISMPLTQPIPLAAFGDIARSGPKGGVYITTDDLLIVLLLIVWSLKLLSAGATLKRKNPLTAPIAVFFSIAFASTILSIPALSAREAASSMLHLLKWFEYTLIYFLVFHNVKTAEEGMRYAGLLMLGVSILSLGSAWLILSGRYIDPFISGIDPSMQIGTAGLWGIGGDKTQLAVLLTLFIFISFARFSAGRPFYFVTALLFLFIFLFTLSRSSYLGLFVGITAVFFMMREKATALLFFLIGAGAVFFLLTAFPNPVYERITGTFSRDSDYKILGIGVDPSSGTRPVAWKYGVTMFLDKPLLGWGHYNMHFLGPKTWGGAENQYLTIAAELGIAGLLSLLYLYWRLHKGFVDIFKSSNGVSRELALSLTGGLWVIMTVGFFAEIFAQWRVLGPFWFLTGIAFALKDAEKRTEREV